MRRILECRHMVMVFILSIFVGSLLTCHRVDAAEYDTLKKGSITIELNDIKTVMKDVGFCVYKVSDIDESIDFSKLDKSSKDMKDLAASLVKKAKDSNASYVERYTDVKGVVTFDNLDQDIYLVVQNKTAKYGTVDPFLVEVPYTKEGKEWVYDVFAQPKGERPVQPQPSPKPNPNPNVQTDDTTPIEWYLGLAIVSFAVIGLCLKERFHHKER